MLTGIFARPFLLSILLEALLPISFWYTGSGRLSSDLGIWLAVFWLLHLLTLLFVGFGRGESQVAPL